VRGTDESMRTLIHFGNKSKSYESALNFNKVNGFKSIVFASKNISKEAAEDFRKQYLAAIRTDLDQDMKLHKLAKSLETDLDFEAIVGFENSLQDGAEEALALYHSLGINTHILSGDNLEHCLMTAQTLNLIGNAKDTGYHHLDFLSEDIGRAQIKRILDIINKSVLRLDTEVKRQSSLPFLKKQSYSETLSRELNIVISGPTVNFICSNRYLTEHFKFILNFTKTVVGYDLNPVNKAQVVDLFKGLNRRTAAFGDGYNDIPMLKSANIGVQVSSRLVPYLFGDVVVDNLHPLAQLVSLYCRNLNNNLHVIVQLFVKYSLTTLLIEFYFQSYIEFSGSSIFSAPFLVLAQLCFVPIGLLYVFLEKQISSKARNSIPGLYSDKNHLTKRMPIKISFFRLVA
jgi:magnesium-transporting ATPase (P-type)